MSPVSAGLVPKAVAIALACLAGMNFIGAIRHRADDAAGPASGLDRWAALLSVCLISLTLFIFILVIELDLAPFWLSGFAFCSVAIFALSERTAWSALWAAVIAGVSIAITVVVFTQLFTVILP